MRTSFYSVKFHLFISLHHNYYKGIYMLTIITVFKMEIIDCLHLYLKHICKQVL